MSSSFGKKVKETAKNARNKFSGTKKKEIERELKHGPYGSGPVPQEDVIYLSADVAPYFFNGSTSTSMERKISDKDAFYLLDDDINQPTVTSNQLLEALNRSFTQQMDGKDWNACRDAALNKILYKEDCRDEYSFIDIWITDRKTVGAGAI
ncbi:hypothetical protein GLAREA_09595 [Glarea lozoyensis ATCC 20868]|uniref:Uncharacterized protein n=1 Tax=Glarea lozoyensis (strain ATCC 20868 / MF5171) TaxID=1116229 RepID=S3CTW8_GLAL2|nr:uncharacterized protein GLAREA_09595 [Glarea lozoyensis ATCC 20868]EPE28474.1 hypothetical protein GLAREA_09595 [Glarea lozoyensis ATCC 20868]